MKTGGGTMRLIERGTNSGPLRTALQFLVNRLADEAGALVWAGEGVDLRQHDG